MLDYHYETFLTVSHTLNYTRAAELMNMSQPAVSNHISYLESTLGVQLFLHKNKKIHLTPEGKFLKEKIEFMSNYSTNTLSELESLNYMPINLGCTLSISDYIIPSFFIDMFNTTNKFRLNVVVENTKTLLNQLAQGKIDAAFIEGDFNQEVFSSIPYQKAKIIGVCSPEFKLANQVVEFKDLFQEHLITREKGSGTRSSFEDILCEQQICITSFMNQSTLGSIDLIKRVVEANVGISFLFDVCVEEELARGSLVELQFAESFKEKKLNFIYLAENPTTDFILTMKEKFE